MAVYAGGDGGDWFAQNAPPAGGALTLSQAIQKVQAATGRTLSSGDVDTLLAKFGGDRTSTFTEAGLAPVIDYVKGGMAAGPGTGTNYGGTDGTPPDPYVSNPNPPRYTPIPTPDALATPYVVPQWTGGEYVAPDKPAELRTPYHLPTQEELEASPGYTTRLNAGLAAKNRSAAAQGSVLNGGTQKALARYGQDYASNEYGALVDQTLGARRQNVSEYDTDASRAYTAYQSRYGNFTDSVARGLGERVQNLGELATARGENQNTFNNRYQIYQDDNARTKDDYTTNVNTRRQANNDYWQHLNDLYQGGLQSANNSYRFSAF